MNARKLFVTESLLWVRVKCVWRVSSANGSYVSICARRQLWMFLTCLKSHIPRCRFCVGVAVAHTDRAVADMLPKLTKRISVSNKPNQLFPFFLFVKAYHSSLMVPETRLVGNMALLPLKTQFKGPARGDGEAVRRYWHQSDPPSWFQKHFD